MRKRALHGAVTVVRRTNDVPRRRWAYNGQLELPATALPKLELEARGWIWAPLSELYNMVPLDFKTDEKLRLGPEQTGILAVFGCTRKRSFSVGGRAVDLCCLLPSTVRN